MNKKGVKMQEKNVQGKKKQEKKVQGNRSQENRIQGKRVQEGKKQGSSKRENKRPESRAVKGVKPEQKQRSEQKQRTEQKQKAAKFGKPVLKQQSGQNVEKGKKNAKKSMCPVMRQCGGCQMLDMPYAEQLKTKRKRLETLLKGICPVKDMIGMEDPFYYRNKVHAVFDRDRRGNIISGIYQENTHNVVPVEKCMIEDQKADEIIGTIRGMLKSFKIRTFDEDTGYGLLRHVLILSLIHIYVKEVINAYFTILSYIRYSLLLKIKNEYNEWRISGENDRGSEIRIAQNKDEGTWHGCLYGAYC